MFRVLVVEDDEDLQDLFCRALKRSEYIPFAASNAEEAFRILDQEYVDLIISDVMMPGMDGFEFVQELRSSKNDVPVLIITAKGEFEDKQKGFNVGADDYMVKPIDIKEMVLRVNALLRRSRSVSEMRLVFGNTILEYSTWTVTDNQGSQIVPQKEFQLLYKLLSFPGQIFTRTQIMEDIWGIDFTDTHTLDVHISRLRERFKENKDFEIVTIRGLGYRCMKRG